MKVMAIWLGIVVAIHGALIGGAYMIANSNRGMYDPPTPPTALPTLRAYEPDPPTPTLTPTPTATPTPTQIPPTATPVRTAPHGVQLTYDQMVSVLVKAGVPGGLHQEFISVACGYGNRVSPNGESTCFPTKIGDQGRSWGLWQINIRYHLWRLGALGYAQDPNLLLDPVINAQVAYMIYQESGWSLWSVKPWL